MASDLSNDGALEEFDVGPALIIQDVHLPRQYEVHLTPYLAFVGKDFAFGSHRHDEVPIDFKQRRSASTVEHR